MGERLVTTNEDVQRSLTQSNTMTERAYADISRSYDTLHTEVKHSANKNIYTNQVRSILTLCGFRYFLMFLLNSEVSKVCSC